ncbi:hypothetical protein [Chitinimonas sp.]|uniref:hypothetical protein n=1 Tax=Chitinimonas sp. TaxID=1934313 RepID=UPI0035B07731
MKRTAIALICVTVLALGVAGWYATRQSSTAPTAAKPVPQPAVVKATSPVVPAAAPVEASEPADEAPETKLSGKDFELEVWINGNDRYRNLLVKRSDGVLIENLQGLDGKIGKLDNRLFSPADAFSLAKLLPEAPREQIVVQGSQQLMEGLGALGSYSIYQVESDRLIELVDVITERDYDGEAGKPGLHFSATVEAAQEQGVPVLIYRYRQEKQAERSLTLRWNGRAFVDESGQYAKIVSKYQP